MIFVRFFLQTGLLGFYDPCLGEEKSLYIRYKFRGKLHHVTLGDFEPLKIPMKSKYFLCC